MHKHENPSIRPNTECRAAEKSGRKAAALRIVLHVKRFRLNGYGTAQGR